MHQAFLAKVRFEALGKDGKRSGKDKLSAHKAVSLQRRLITGYHSLLMFSQQRNLQFHNASLHGCHIHVEAVANGRMSKSESRELRITVQCV